MATTTTRVILPLKLTTELAKKVDLDPATGKAALGQLPDTFNAIAPTVVTIPYAAQITPDASKGQVQRCTLTGNVTVLAPLNPREGQQLMLQLVSSGAARVVTLQTGVAGGFQFGSDISSIPGGQAGKVQYIGCVFRSASARWDVIAVANGFPA